jgi:hypothetical protein
MPPDRTLDIAIATRLGWTDIRPEVRRGHQTDEYEGRQDNQRERLPRFEWILNEGRNALATK